MLLRSTSVAGCLLMVSVWAPASSAADSTYSAAVISKTKPVLYVG